MSKDDTKAFECRMCGHCCEGSGGIVMSRKDRERLAAHLGLGVDEMLAQYAERVNGKWIVRTGDDGLCVFFTDKCSVHVAKPNVCRAWPFFRGNLVDEDSWRMAHSYCPGINLDAGHAAFVAEGRAYIEAEGLAEDDDDEAGGALNIP